MLRPSASAGLSVIGRALMICKRHFSFTLCRLFLRIERAVLSFFDISLGILLQRLV
ncbi:hypothetical protein AB0C34_21195 [Nocardia sp. NPDC049220]|uniref:hypothetical protein n=1 Tax=Nocardia sp. NPDC049220 TaxID=3155273 RepID=UPI0033DE8135